MIFKKIKFLFFVFPFFLLADEYLSDEKYYDKGIELYKSAKFSEAFIIFYNLSIKGDRNSQFNLSNMYSGGIGTTQDFSEALKWSWLCSLGGEKKCFENLESLKSEVDEKTLEKISKNVEELLEKELYKSQDIQYALKLGFWFEKFSPNIDFEKSYMWYSVAVTGGLYKAMKVRDKVRKKIENETVIKLQKEANKIYTNIKYFVNKNGDQR